MSAILVKLWKLASFIEEEMIYILWGLRVDLVLLALPRMLSGSFIMVG
jgi:hypothetical protein